MTLRVNTMLLTRDDYLQRLKDQGGEAAPCRYAPDGVNVVGRNAVPELPGYREGWFYVQDEGAQLISLALGPKPGETILDACAAPGGKATHLAALMEDRGTIVAVDQDPRRLSRIEDNQKRLHLHSIQPRVGNLESDPGFAFKDRFDRILVDAPCSALGVLRRHPEGRWRKGPELIKHYVLVQSRILGHVAPYLKPGGVMLYSTCSTEREENEDRIAAFLSTHPEFESVDLRDLLPESARHLVDNGYLHTTFSDERMDGFFAAGMKKKD
jgi:16S rRNA (cytosine967-C5)-methyltransferase